MANSALLYEGPSELDGQLIVCIVSGLRRPTNNRKTGDMLQTWILRADQSPLDAVWSGADVSICGGCAFRATKSGRLQGQLNRACYVTLHHAPLAIWTAYQMGDLSVLTPQEFATQLSGRYLRLGSYGDPAAVPMEVWDTIVPAAAGHTGYTHQWKGSKFAGLRRYCMASVESLAQQREAAAQGWSTYLVVPHGGDPGSAQQCPTDVDPAAQCRSCGACDGTTSTQRHIYILSHGAGARHVAPPRKAHPNAGVLVPI